MLIGQATFREIQFSQKSVITNETNKPDDVLRYSIDVRKRVKLLITPFFAGPSRVAWHTAGHVCGAQTA